MRRAGARHLGVPAASLALWLLSCAHSPRPFAGDDLVETRLFFGMSRITGDPVRDERARQEWEERWQTFLDEVVTPLYPDGLTVLPAIGQWRPRHDGEAATMRQYSRVLLLLHDGGADHDRRIRAIIDRYKQQFDQESVLRVESRARVAF